MKKLLALALAGSLLGACASGIHASRGGVHATPATQTNAHNPSMPNLADSKMPRTTSRDTAARGNPGGTGGSGVN
jgi:hypothetical protein